MIDDTKIADTRRDYGDLALDATVLDADPFVQFKHWFDERLQNEKHDPTAMVLSTVDEKGRPDSRVVLLKGLENQRFIFYTNYDSTKGRQLQKNPYAALNFYWPETARQVRVRGVIQQTSKEQSDAYFLQRPILSQLSAIASPQSQEIAQRSDLEKILNRLIATSQQQSITRPNYWGGYCLIPEEIEFWQGRNNRLHDRFQYHLNKGLWTVRRLAP